MQSRIWALAAALGLAACAAVDSGDASSVVPVLLLGEQHDAPQHQQLQHDMIDALAARGVLAAVVLEMAERGRTTAGLPAGASEEQVRDALAWRREGGWPWEAYGPAVMAAVRAGVPVLGANLTREEMRSARGDPSLAQLVPQAAWRATLEDVRTGHCDLLPPAQIEPMARIQVARDRSMARSIEAQVTPGKTVVLLAGAGHADPEVGVPLHLPARLRPKAMLLPRVDTGKDYCAELRQQLRPQP